MTHDPLCPWFGSTEFDTVISCDDCDLIARVREDERKKYETYSNARKVGREQGYSAALRDAVTAIEALVCISSPKTEETAYKKAGTP